MGYKAKKKTPIRRMSLTSIALVLAILWLILSSIADLSPIRTLSGVKNFFSKEENTQGMNRSQLERRISTQEEEINKLRNLRIEENKSQDITAHITIDGTSLNFRSLPTVQSVIIEKLPTDTPVIILDSLPQLDTLQGVENRWYKVEYQQLTGWVWGQYLRR